MWKSTRASFAVVGMPDPVIGDTVWYVLGTGTIDGQMFAQYAQEAHTMAQAAAVMENPPARERRARNHRHTVSRKLAHRNRRNLTWQG
jgi:hypothetical protein